MSNFNKQDLVALTRNVSGVTEMVILRSSKGYWYSLGLATLILFPENDNIWTSLSVYI